MTDEISKLGVMRTTAEGAQFFFSRKQIDAEAKQWRALEAKMRERAEKREAELQAIDSMAG